jgi:1-acyl-sn-glycerol-3-phosphate acyltransferase
MWRFISKFIYKISGWKVVGEYPSDIKKAVLIAAPHTSNWDFLYSRAGLFLMGAPVKFIIKQEWVNGPLGFLLKRLGAIPVDRNARNKSLNFVEQVIEMFNQNEELIIMIAPEGTRKRAHKWRSGFYYMATNAKIPILLGYLDYKKKHAGVGGVFYPTGNYEKDLMDIKAFYKTVSAKYPEKSVN